MPQLFNVQTNAQDVPKIHPGQSGRTSTAEAKTESGQSFHSIFKQALPENSSHKQKTPDSIDDNLPSSPDEDLKIDLSALAKKLNSDTPQELLQGPGTTITEQPLSERQQPPAPLFTNTINPQAVSQLNQPSLVAATTTLSDTQGLATIAGQQQSQSLLPDFPVQQSVQPSPVVTSPQQEALLKQVQSIVNSGAEAGILSIKNVKGADGENPLRPQQLNLAAVGIQETGGPEIVTNSPLTKGDGFTALQEGVFASTLRNRQQQLEGIRHDKTQQFYDAKTQPQNVLSENLNLTSKQQGNEMSGQGSIFSQATPLSQNPESSGTFSLPVNQGADPLSTQLSDTGKTSMLPSGTLVQDQEVIQQIVERFRVNKRLLESKIQLKLHPAELGKLEIDLTVKEGSIRANVVAQSQHVQEILEKNIAKLKSLLEQQGFTVEEISVTSKSETVDGFDLFDQQLSNSESSNFQKKSDKTETHTPFVLDEFQESYVETPSGVNIKA